jgi:hypothetical protein
VKALASLPRWLRLLLVAANTAASVGLTLANWSQVWPNIQASWVLAGPAFAAAAGVVLRRLDRHHEAIKAHVDRALAAPPPESGESP